MNTPPRPIFADIPAELTARPQWVCWRLEPRPGDTKPTKIPYNPRTGKMALAGHPDTWGTFRAAVAAYEASQNGRDPYSGVGFELADDDGLFGGDLDGCIDPETGEVAEWASTIVAEADTYTESSPSGTGLRFIGFGTLPPDRRKKGPVEMYDRGRFLTITGRRFGNAPEGIAECGARLPALHARLFPPKPAPAPRVPRPSPAGALSLTDQQLLSKASAASNGAKFDALWRGDLGGYGSQSEADLALCSLLAFWTRGDAGRMDGLFRQSGLCREKWDVRHHGDGRTYGEGTIQEALAGKSEFYDPAAGRIQRGKKAAEASHGAAGGETRVQEGTVGERLSVEAAPTVGGIKRVGALKLALTDIGNARRLVELFGADLRYDHSFGQWFLWDGRRFQADQTGQIFQRAKRTAQSIYHEAGDCPDDARREEIAKHAKASESRSRLEAMIALAQTEPEVAVTADVWDGDPWLLNCRNGALDLRTGCLRPHERRDLCTRLAPVDYDPSAACPLWEKSLARWQPQEDVRAFLQRAVGYTLTGDVREEVLFFTYGDGKNGKSKFTETLQALLSEYGVKAAAETFMLKKSDRGAASPELVALIGRRFVSVSEVGGGQSFSEALLKDMTGGDTMTARPLYQNEVNFRPLFKLWFYGNVRPTINGTDEGIWRRMMLIPFKVTIPEQERDLHLLPKLLAELPGVLNWALAGCRQWQAGGLNPPKSVLTATEEYRKDMDTIGAFLEEKCARHEGYTERAADLYEAYTEWSKAAGEKPVTQNAFGHSLTQRGLERYRTGGGFKWRGIALRGPSEDDEDEAEQVDTTEQEAVYLVNLMHSESGKSHTRGRTGESYGFSDTQGSQGTHPAPVGEAEWERV